MKIAIYIIILLAVLIYSGNPTINFKAFTVSFEKPYLPFAIFFLIASIAMYTMQYNTIGYKKGYKEAVNDCLEIINDEAKNQPSKSTNNE